MLEVTAMAITKLKEYMEQNKIDSAIRIALMQGGWAGPSLGLALDEPKNNDKTYDESDIKFLVDNDLMKNCGDIKLDFNDAGYQSGFLISSTIALGGGGCGSSCSSGSCS